MPSPTDPRPGIAYRRPGGDPTRVHVESGGRTDLPVEDLPRHEWTEAVHPTDRDRLRDALDGERVDVVYRIEVGNDTIWIHECGRRVAGDVVGYLFPACDRIRRQRRLERQRERLDEFAGVVSHDLRNPMSVAVGNVELARQLEDEAADERLDRAMDALDRMDALVSDLLSLAREGRFVESTSEVDLRTVVDQAWSTVGESTNARLVVDDPLPSVDCDRRRLRQALENLFRNAIEHGSEEDPAVVAETADDIGSDGGDGSVRVRVGRTRDGFYVTDDGPGIDPVDRDSVFEPGHTTDDDGTGFGLAIVERIAEAHGWSVSVVESRAWGARFEFENVDVLEGSADPVTDGRSADGPERSSPQ